MPQGGDTSSVSCADKGSLGVLPRQCDGTVE